MPNKKFLNVYLRVPMSEHFKSILLLAGPIAISLIATKSMMVADTVLLGVLGPGLLAAGSFATIFFFTLLHFFNGLLTSVTVLVSTYHGAGKDEQIPSIYASGILIAAILTVPFFVILTFLEELLLMWGMAPDTAQNIGLCALILRWGAPAGFLGIGLMRSFLPAIGGARTLLIVSITSMILNIILNYGLINGHFGFPKLGLTGSATATVITLWVSALALFFNLHFDNKYKPFIKDMKTDYSVFCALLKIGWPVSVTFGIEGAVLMVTSLRVGALDPESLAAHQITFSMVDAIFMLPLSIALATNVRVGFWNGAGQSKEVVKSGLAGLGMGMLIMFLTVVVFVFFPHLIIAVYLNMNDVANAETIVRVIQLLAVVAFFQMGDGVQVIASSCLRALKDTKIPMIIAFFGYWVIGFPSGQYLAIQWQLGAQGMWIGLAIGATVVAVTLTIRFLRYERRKINTLS